MAAPGSPVHSEFSVGTMAGRSGKKGKRVNDGLGDSIDEDMVATAKGQCDEAFKQQPRLYLRVAYLIQSGKINGTTKERQTEVALMPIPASCNKFSLLRKERLQVLLAKCYPEKYDEESTDLIPVEELRKMARLGWAITDSCALPQTQGNMVILTDFVQRRVQDVGQLINHLEFELDDRRVMRPIWKKTGAFYLVPDPVEEGMYDRVMMAGGAKFVYLKPKADDTYFFEFNTDYSLSRLCTTSSDVEIPMKKRFEKEGKACPDLMNLKTVTDEPVNAAGKGKKRRVQRDPASNPLLQPRSGASSASGASASPLDAMPTLSAASLASISETGENEEEVPEGYGGTE